MKTGKGEPIAWEHRKLQSGLDEPLNAIYEPKYFAESRGGIGRPMLRCPRNEHRGKEKGGSLEARDVSEG